MLRRRTTKKHFEVCVYAQPRGDGFFDLWLQVIPPDGQPLTLAAVSPRFIDIENVTIDLQKLGPPPREKELKPLNR